ncbi:MAG: hypothetical protein FWB71_01890 [Defluviitaleaceae bacterium]|nr:hypothetical protein [Defluviitaleaceae bacterium]
MSSRIKRINELIDDHNSEVERMKDCRDSIERYRDDPDPGFHRKMNEIHAESMRVAARLKSEIEILKRKTDSEYDNEIESIRIAEKRRVEQERLEAYTSATKKFQQLEQQSSNTYEGLEALVRTYGELVRIFKELDSYSDSAQFKHQCEEKLTEYNRRYIPLKEERDKQMSKQVAKANLTDKLLTAFNLFLIGAYFYILFGTDIVRSRVNVAAFLVRAGPDEQPIRWIQGFGYVEIGFFQAIVSFLQIGIIMAACSAIIGITTFCYNSAKKRNVTSGFTMIRIVGAVHTIAVLERAHSLIAPAGNLVSRYMFSLGASAVIAGFLLAMTGFIFSVIGKNKHGLYNGY